MPSSWRCPSVGVKSIGPAAHWKIALAASDAVRRNRMLLRNKRQPVLQTGGVGCVTQKSRSYAPASLRQPDFPGSVFLAAITLYYGVILVRNKSKEEGRRVARLSSTAFLFWRTREGAVSQSVLPLSRRSNRLIWPRRRSAPVVLSLAVLPVFQLGQPNWSGPRRLFLKRSAVDCLWGFWGSASVT